MSDALTQGHRVCLLKVNQTADTALRDLRLPSLEILVGRVRNGGAASISSTRVWTALSVVIALGRRLPVPR